MNGFDIDGFISSQRAKLVDEKSRLERKGRVGGILPSDSMALEKSDKLRRERQLEYREHLKNRRGMKGPAPSNKTISISEVRQNMSREREREITHNKAKLERRQEREPTRNKDYTSLRDKRLAEERRYQGDMHNHSYIGHQYDTDGAYDDDPKVSFENDPRTRKRSTWDEEENGLMEWTRTRAHIPRNRAQTPPAVDSPKVGVDTSMSSMRSISAPNVAARGIAALGAQDDARARRLRQLKYAEELRNQMKERGGDGGRRGKAKGKPRLDGYHPCNEDCAGPPAAWDHLAGEGNGKRKQRATREEDFSPHHHRQHYDGEDEERRTHKYPPPQRSPQRSSRDRYDYYQEPYGPPPPPPRFQGGYGRWGPPYYPYPPPGPGYEHVPYADMYFPPYHPGSRGAYEPPPPRSRRPHPPDQYWDDQDRRDYEPYASEEDEHKEGKKLRWRNDASLQKKQSEKEPQTSSGILGLGKIADSKPDKTAAYRRELENQMKEKKERSEKEKLAREKFENQVDVEIYDPFGKGGCGAPVRDQFGNLVADLKQMRQINENRLSNNSPLSQRQSKEGAQEVTGSSPAQNSPRTTILKYDKMSDENAKKASQENYRDYLRRQVQEKEEMKRKEKEMLKLEEERELEQLERDRKRLKEEYQQELERQRRKEEEARNKNEAIKREAEVKRQMAIMQREQEALREEAERRALVESRLPESVANLSFSPAQPRPDSPPVPTLRHKMKKNLSNPPPSTPDRPEQSFKSSSPPVPTLRKKQRSGHQAQSAESHVDSAQPTTYKDKSREPTNVAPPQESHHKSVARRDHVITEVHSKAPVTTTTSPPEPEQNRLLTQLGAIRMHLQAELAKQTAQSPHSDIFDRAKQQKPKIAAPKVPRQKESRSALNEFSRLKYKDPTHRTKFLEDFPELPDSDSALEVQQIALLRHQHEELKKTQRDNPRQEGDHIRGTRPSETPMLQTQTTQVSLNSAYPFADNMSRLSITDSILGNPTPTINEPRRGWGRASSPGAASKVTVNTVEVDNMAARNEERLKRLEAILNAGPPRQGSSDSLHQNQFLSSQGRANLPAVHVPRRGTISRQSEVSLDCDTQHLPA